MSNTPHHDARRLAETVARISFQLVAASQGARVVGATKVRELGLDLIKAVGAAVGPQVALDMVTRDLLDETTRQRCSLTNPTPR